jgi:hypothetical protein
MPKRDGIKGCIQIVTLVLCGLFSVSAGAAESTAIDCRKPDVVVPHSTVSDLGISKGLGV